MTTTQLKYRVAARSNLGFRPPVEASRPGTMAFLTRKLPSSDLKAPDPRAVLVLISDDQDWRDLKATLQAAGLKTRRVSDAESALRDLSRRECGIFLIDLETLHRGVMDFIKRVSVQAEIGIILLAASADRLDRVLALELGADDVIEKPYDPRELAARVRRLARRLERTAGDDMRPRSRHWSLDRVHRIVSAAGIDPVVLTPAEFRLFEVFLQYPGKVLAREFLLDALFGHASAPLDRSIDITVTRLRRKIEHDPKRPQYIKTIRLAGYCFEPDGSG